MSATLNVILLIALITTAFIGDRDLAKQQRLIDILQEQNMDLQDTINHDCTHPLDIYDYE